MISIVLFVVGLIVLVAGGSWYTSRLGDQVARKRRPPS